MTSSLMPSVIEGAGIRDEFTDEQLIAALDDIEKLAGSSEITPLPCYSTNPPCESDCISLKTLRNSHVNTRRSRKK